MKKNIGVKEVFLNKKEIKKMLRFLDSHPETTRISLRFDASGIGEKITMKIDGQSTDYDVTDYLSW